MLPVKLRIGLLWSVTAGAAWGDTGSAEDSVDTAQNLPQPLIELESLCGDGLDYPSLCTALREAEVCSEPEDERASECADELQSLRALLGDASILLDDRGTMAQRMEAARQLSVSADPRALPFVRAASRSDESEIRALAVSVASNWKSAEAVDLLVQCAQRERDEEIMEAAFQALEDLSMPESGEALYIMAGSETLANDRRARASQALESAYPELLADRGAPSHGSDRLGMTAAVAANGLVGGMALGSVGVWGQSDAGIGIGAMGGGAIGVGTGVLYARGQPLSRGQGLRYASNVGWGTTGAIILNEIADTDDNSAALVLTAGTVTGAVTGFRAMQQSLDEKDVMETNLTGYLGLQLARGTVLSIMEDQPCHWDVDLEDASCWAYRETRTRTAQIGMLAGSAGGLAFGHVMSSRWNPSSDDIYLATSLGAQSAWVAGWLPEALELDIDVAPLVNLGFHGGVSAALAVAHRRPVDSSTTSMMNYGAVAGNALGAGLALIPANSKEQTIVRSMLGVGMLSTGLGAWAAPQLELSTGDATMVGVGTGLTMIQVASLAQVLQDYGFLQHSDQSVGLVLSAGSLSSAGLMALGSRFDPEPLDSLFIASTGGWGYWFSGLGMVALDPDIHDSGKLLIATASADLAMGVGGLILWEGTELQPRDTLMPQLIGVGGATIGSLVVALGSDDGQKIAWGALGGSAVGLATGSLLSFNLDSGTAQPAALTSGLIPDRFRQRLDLPGEWSISALPMMQEGGSLGGHVSIRGYGF
jgi:hypothetical protein